jgi:hypothetical protein
MTRTNLYKLKTIAGQGKKKKLPKPELKIEPPPAAEELDPPEVREIGRLIGDMGYARKIWPLYQQMKQKNRGTLPEVLAYDYLTTNGIPFQYLAQVFGGHSRRGGIEIDFIVNPGGDGAVAWFVNGEYWHTRQEVADSDVSDMLRVKGTIVNGSRISQTVAVWEGDTYRRRPEVFQMGLMGVGLRG